MDDESPLDRGFLFQFPLWVVVNRLSSVSVKGIAFTAFVGPPLFEPVTSLVEGRDYAKNW
jgi:hypothetical protein